MQNTRKRIRVKRIKEIKNKKEAKKIEKINYNLLIYKDIINYILL